MALTTFQRTLCHLLADHRVASGESYVAGAAALNELLSAPRLSRDLDLFHDSEAAVAASWREDRALLEKHGFSVRVEQERPGYVEAEVGRPGESVRMEWARDSAFRFFPLMTHEEFDLVLHPFDLATSKVLALVGRLEVRDWIDVTQQSAFNRSATWHGRRVARTLASTRCRSWSMRPARQGTRPRK